MPHRHRVWWSEYFIIMIGPQNVAQSALLIKSRWLFIHRTYDNTHVNEIVLQKAQKCNTGTVITDVRCDIFSNYQQIIIMVKHVNESCSNWTSGRCTFCSHTPGNVKIITESRVFTAYHGIRKYSTLKSFLWIRNVRNHVKKLKWSKKKLHDDKGTVQNTLEKPLKLTTNLWKDLRKQKHQIP